MKKLQCFWGIVASVAIVIIMLISSFEIGMYADFDFYQKEYEKYKVLSELDMDMEDVMYVTEEMMAYLRGDRQELSVITNVDGKKQDFFNEQDRFHMWEVQKLFVGGLSMRRGAISILINSLLIMALCYEKTKNKLSCISVEKDIKQAEKMKPRNILCKSYQIVLGILTAVIVIVGAAVALNFDKVFTVFHKIFFDNDLWIFNPAEDYMIRMLPQGFFYDFVIRIGSIFIVMLLIGLFISILGSKKNAKFNEKNC